MIEFLFLDLDDTILDFQKAERLALAKTLESFGLLPTDTVLARYHEINREHWERLERKELTRQQVLVGRFAALFAEMGLSAQAEQVARAYEENLSQGHYFLPGAEEALQSLRKKYKLYLASNGTARVQAGRLKSAGITDLNTQPMAVDALKWAAYTYVIAAIGSLATLLYYIGLARRD